MRTQTIVILPVLYIAGVVADGQLSTPWRVIGPGGGGAQFRPTWNPLNPNMLAVATDMNAGFVSTDRGGHWRRFDLRSPPRTILFDGLDPAGIYVLTYGNAGLYRSGDSGLSWHLLYPPTASVRRILFQDDEAETYLDSGGAYPPLEAFAPDPARRGVFYAARNQVLELSGDEGKHWRPLSRLSGPPILGTGQSLFIDPGSPPTQRTVWTVSATAVDFWEGGRARRAAPPGIERIREAAASFSPAALYLLTKPRGLWVTRDSGRSWQPLHPALDHLGRAGVTPPQLRGVATSALHGNAIYVSYAGLQTPSGGGPLLGVARSLDGGRSWGLVWKDGHRLPDPNVRDIWITPRLGVEWGENPLEIGVHPDNPDLVLASDLGRTMLTTNGGRSWDGVYSTAMPGGTWTTTGIDVTSSNSVHADPFRPRKLLVSHSDIALMASEDGGASWSDANRGIPAAWRNTVYWAEFDPAVKDRLWAAASSVHDLPRMKMVRRWQPGMPSWRGGVVASHDGGSNWERSSVGLPDAPVTHLLLDPRSRHGHRTLYATVFGAGVYKSTDDGRSWAKQSRGIAGRNPAVWRLTLDETGGLYAVVARRSESLEHGNPETDGAVYRSDDGAATWKRLPLPPGLNGPTSIAVDPADPRRLYLSAFGRFKPGQLDPPQSGGIYLSEDGGSHWKAVHTTDQYVYDVAPSPGRPSILMATGFQASLWRSADRGLSWVRVPGFDVKDAYRVAFDPHHPGMIFVTTYGSGVWYGPSTGATAREAIVTPAVRYK
jgi:photosystem II stability/assembly factor-like uncharacterized protein